MYNNNYMSRLTEFLKSRGNIVVTVHGGPEGPVTFSGPEAEVNLKVSEFHAQLDYEFHQQIRDEEILLLKRDVEQSNA